MYSDDVDWLVPLSAITAVMVALGRPATLATAYAVLALTAGGVLCLVWLLWWLFQQARSGNESPITALLVILRANRRRILCAFAGIVLVSLLASSFSSLKGDIPRLVPFYLDQPLADFDKSIFGVDGWRWMMDRFGFAFPVVNIAYGFWIPVQLVTVTALLFSRPSPTKAQAMIAYAIMWSVIGVGLATLFSSAGPIFYDRLYGGERFSGLLLAIRGTFSIEAADYLWTQYTTGKQLVGNGISAMPSLHVAGTVWLALVVRRFWPRLAPLAFAYVALIWIGSVMLGWHYATDGIVGAAGAVFCWKFAQVVVAQMIGRGPRALVAGAGSVGPDA